MNDDTFDFISRITNNNQYTNIEVTVLGPIIYCPLSNSKKLAFQPQLTKIQNLYNMEMKLIATYDELPVEFHFNVTCEELNNYYASLHPRTMTTSWNNTLYINLPVANIKPKKK
eukprot:50366_1